MKAYERAQLIRLAQDDNWLDHLRAEALGEDVVDTESAYTSNMWQLVATCGNMVL